MIGKPCLKSTGEGFACLSQRHADILAESQKLVEAKAWSE